MKSGQTLYEPATGRTYLVLSMEDTNIAEGTEGAAVVMETVRYLDPERGATYILVGNLRRIVATGRLVPVE